MKFLHLPEAGVAISERAVRAISLSHRASGGLKVSKTAEVPLPEGALSGGIVGDRTALASALGKLASEHGIKSASVALPEERGYIYVAEIDRVPEEDMRDVVAFTVEENVPVSLKDSVFSYQTFEEEGKLKASVSVIPAESALAYEEAFAAAGIHLLSMRLESEAIAEALTERGERKIELIVHLEERKYMLIVAGDGVVRFSSTHAINQADLGSPALADAVRAEVRKMLVFWATRSGGERGQRLERIIVSGQLAADDAFVARIMGEIEIPYSIGNVWTNVMSLDEHLPEMPFISSLKFAAAIGAALPSTGDAGLLSESARKKPRGSRSLGLAATLIILTALIALTLINVLR